MSIIEKPTWESLEMLIQDLQFVDQEHIQADLKNWKKLLFKVKAALQAPNNRQMMEESVKIWLGKLQELVDDVEDMIDEFETQVSPGNKLLVEAAEPSTRKFLMELIPNCCPNLSSQSSWKFDSMIISKIEKITNKFKDIVTQKDHLGLNENSPGKSKMARKRLPTTSLVNEAKEYGREKDKEEIVQLLIRDDLSCDGFSVIPIIGMEGVGKTTLAQVVYNDVEVKDHFDLKAWVYVSDDFDVIRLTRTILRSITDHPIKDDDFNLLQQELRKKLHGKKFLFVLDDVWNENYNEWTILNCPFEAGAPGSQIIVTTRNQGVALVMGTIPAYQLKDLSNDD
ncbi:NB-ARC domain-containing disease resistance protein [Melia azedarach]|uniref:NB-ARC domain-containing disease resistance protein n=1 Tax=Melia azedarach TaxID=155640 RepID=A0ACC1YIU6_MELAZ|nr:NB-ARC domain-containing disease resistance protein [Melia azedarach]